jgi:hypothetical protein
MIPDPDIWRAAQLIIKFHREDALMVAAQRFVELIDADDESGAAVWKGVMQAVDDREPPIPMISASPTIMVHHARNRQEQRFREPQRVPQVRLRTERVFTAQCL